MVGAGRFELPTPCSRSKCATRLRYALHSRAGWEIWAKHLRNADDRARTLPSASSASTPQNPKPKVILQPARNRYPVFEWFTSAQWFESGLS